MAATPRDVLARDHASALELLRRVGAARTRRILERAQRDLERRLHEAIAGPGAGSYTAANVRAALAQVRQAARPSLVISSFLIRQQQTRVLGAALRCRQSPLRVEQNGRGMRGQNLGNQ